MWITLIDKYFDFAIINEWSLVRRLPQNLKQSSDCFLFAIFSYSAIIYM